MVCADTGADECVFPLSFAGLLGLDPLTLPTSVTSGVGRAGNVTYYADIVIDVAPGIKFGSKAGFTGGLELLGHGLLGQDGFFDKFNTIFSHNYLTAWSRPKTTRMFPTGPPLGIIRRDDNVIHSTCRNLSRFTLYQLLTRVVPNGAFVSISFCILI
jgi:hypothetical protein